MEKTKILSLKAAIITPLLLPILGSVALNVNAPGESFLMGLLLVFIAGSLISYIAFAGLFLPGLLLLREFSKVDFKRVCILGFVTGLVSMYGVLFVTWLTSGNDSSPPDDFLSYTLNSLEDPMFWLFFPVGGIVTAAIYWFIATKTSPSSKAY